MTDWTELYKKVLRMRQQNINGNLDWSNRVSIGDYGTFTKGSFIYLNNISNAYDIPLNLAEPTAGIDISGDLGSVSMARTDLSGAAVGDGFAGDMRVTWSFSESQSLTLIAKNVTNNSLASPQDVANSLLSKIGKEWKDDWIVISSIWELSAGFLIGTDEKNSSYSISGNGTAVDDALSGEGSAKFSVDTTTWNGIANTYPTQEMQNGTQPFTPVAIQFQAFRFDGKRIVYF